MEKIGVWSGGRARWKAALFFVLSGLITASWSSRIPDVQQQLGLANAAWGTVLFASPVGQVSSLFLAGWLTTRFGIQKVMVSCTIGLALVLVLAGLSENRYQLMAVLWGIGFGRTVLNIAINTNASEVQKLYTRPIISTFHGLWSLACFVAAGIGTIMIVNKVAPLMHFVLIAGSCILATLVYESQRKKTPKIAAEKKPFFVKPDRYLFLLGCIVFCGMLCEAVMFDWSVNYFQKAVKADKSFVTAGYTSFILAMTTGRLLGDKMVGRFGALPMLMFNGVLMAMGFLLAASLPLLLTAILGFILIGLGNSIVVPVVFSLAGKSKKMPLAYALTAVTLLGYCGFLLAPLLIGFLSDVLSMQWAFACVGLFGLLIVFLALRVKTFRLLHQALS